MRSAVYRLTDEGVEFADKGSSEVRVFNSIPAEGVSMAGFDSLPGVVAMGPSAMRGRGKCMKERWLKIDKKAGTIAKLVTEVVDTVQVQMIFVRC